MHVVAKTVYTYEVMKRFIIFNAFRRLRDIIVGGVSALIFLLLAVGEAVSNGFTLYYYAAVVGLIATPVVIIGKLIVLPLYRAKRSLVAKDSVNRYVFTNVRIIIKSETAEYMGEETLLYSAVKKLCETKDFLYLYINKNQAYIVSKQDIAEHIDEIRARFVR